MLHVKQYRLERNMFGFQPPQETEGASAAATGGDGHGTGLLGGLMLFERLPKLLLESLTYFVMA